MMSERVEMSDKIYMKDFMDVIDLTKDRIQLLTGFTSGSQPLIKDELERLVASVASKVVLRLEGLWPLGFPPIHISPGATATITARPQLTPWLGLRLVVPRSTVYMEIVDIRVGKNSCLLSNQAISAHSFPLLPEGARYCNLSMPPAYEAMDVSLVVRNLGPTTETFMATMFGRVGHIPISRPDSGAASNGLIEPKKNMPEVLAAGETPSLPRLCYACSKGLRQDGALLCAGCLETD
jgi:hypothetical protein